jgi:hypothetical protein
MHPYRTAVASLALGVVLLGASAARAESIIKHPGDHPRYSFEAEPHLSIGYAGGIGPGFRGTVVLLDNGFIPSINNSIGIGFGLDWIFYGDGCHDGFAHVHGCGTYNDAMIPVVMQWNFWLAEHWSVFGEPGLVLHLRSGHADHFAIDPFVIYGGGRYHFNESVALTMRLGTPFFDDSVFSIGVSFLL